MNKPIRKQQALQSCYLFGGLSEADIETLALVSAREFKKSGTDIFMKGDDADGLRIVLSGIVRIWISDEDGRELTVTLLEDGDSFGEIALFDELPRSANATTLEDVECLFVPRAAAETLLKKSPQFAKEVIQILCETLRRNTEEMGAVMFLNLDKRLAQKLCFLALSYAHINDNQARFSRKFAQNDLAKMLGVTREAINKRLTALTQKELIKTENGLLTILDLAALAKLN